MPHALRFTGDRWHVVEAEARLLRVLPAECVVRKAEGLFQVVDLAAVSGVGSLPSDWVLYEPTYLDFGQPAFDYQRLMRS
jgi:hypothetical protein